MPGGWVGCCPGIAKWFRAVPSWGVVGLGGYLGNCIASVGKVSCKRIRLLRLAWMFDPVDPVDLTDPEGPRKSIPWEFRSAYIGLTNIWSDPSRFASERGTGDLWTSARAPTSPNRGCRIETGRRCGVTFGSTFSRSDLGVWIGRNGEDCGFWMNKRVQT